MLFKCKYLNILHIKSYIEVWIGEISVLSVKVPLKRYTTVNADTMFGFMYRILVQSFFSSNYLTKICFRSLYLIEDLR